MVGTPVGVKRTWLSAKGSIMRCSVAMRRIQLSEQTAIGFLWRQIAACFFDYKLQGAVEKEGKIWI